VKAGKVLLIVLGSLAILIALGLLAAGGGLLWAHTTQRDNEGFYTSELNPLPYHRARDHVRGVEPERRARLALRPGPARNAAPARLEH